MADLTGQYLGRYHLVERLGEGGMATVYKGYDTRLERSVAVKVIRTDMILPAMLDTMLHRFEREAKVLAKLSHPHIVNIHDYGEHAGEPYLVMEYLPGGTLKPLTGKPTPYARAASLLAPVARALEYAHARGVLHRDVKPANILFNEMGEVKLSDFGIARILESEQTTQLTTTGVGIGTPEYMAPEQWVGQTCPATDQYALGVVFYELVTGRIPYKADTPAAVLLKQANEPLPRPRQFAPDLPQAAEEVIFKVLAKQPEARYPDMGGFAQALEALLAESASGVTAVTKLEAAPASGEMGVAEAIQSQWQDKQSPETPLSAQETDLSYLQAESRKRSTVAGQLAPTTALPKGEERAVTDRRMGLWAILMGAVVLLGLLIFALVAGGIAVKNLLANQSSTRTAQAIAAQATKPSSPFPSSATPSYTSTPPLVFTPSLTPNLAPGKTTVSEIDGMTLLYVPAGEFLMGSADSDTQALDNEKPQHEVYVNAFWIDQTEVTNRMCAFCVQAGACQPPGDTSSFMRSSYYGDPQFGNYPVIRVNWNEAKAYCEWAGQRLPTEAEWEKAARGTDGRIYPWGNTPVAGNLLNFCDKNCTFDWRDSTIDDGYADTAPVGSYPAGTSPYGALDMVGNVWEWVADWYGGNYYSRSPFQDPLGPESGNHRALRGGSWNPEIWNVRAAARYWFDPVTGHPGVGLRCARSMTVSPTEQPTATIEITLTPVPSLGVGSTMVSEIDGTVLVYVPAGEFLMGSTDSDTLANSDEKPRHKVYLDGYWIDQTEVTNRMYALCVTTGACQPPRLVSSGTRGSYYGSLEYGDYPVIYVSWNDAVTYCEWAGRRLPTEAEWEKSARGTDGSIYPWGNNIDCAHANYGGCAGDTSRVGSYPAAVSPYGALDMVGNVWEWVADWYGESYYASCPYENPQGPANGSTRVLRGGSWSSSQGVVRSASRGWVVPGERNGYFGFRCALSP